MCVDPTNCGGHCPECVAESISPCPFCKYGKRKERGRPMLETYVSAGGQAWVACPACRAEGPPRNKESDAVRDWNAAWEAAK